MGRGKTRQAQIIRSEHNLAELREQSIQNQLLEKFSDIAFNIKTFCSESTVPSFINAFKEYKNLQNILQNLKIIEGTKLHKQIQSELSTTLSYFLTCIPEEYTLKNIYKLLEILDINLAEFSYKSRVMASADIHDPTNAALPDDIMSGRVLKFTTAEFTVKTMHNLWAQGKPEDAKELLEYCAKQKVPFNGLQARNNALLYALEHYPNEVDFIRILAESTHININALITPQTDEAREVYCLTPFAQAASGLNKELIFLFLENGADPFLADTKTSQFNKKELLRVCFANHLGDGKAFSLLNFFQQLDNIVEEFYLQKLIGLHTALENGETLDLSSLPPMISSIITEKDKSPKITNSPAPHPKQSDKLKTKKKPNSEKKHHWYSSTQDETLETSGSADEEQQKAFQRIETPTISPEPSAQEQMLEQYINYKEQASQNQDLSAETREEHRFDSLVLRYIQTNNDQILDEIYNLLSEEHSAEADISYLRILSELGASNAQATDILAARPLLLHKFFSIKKQMQNQTLRTEEISEVMLVKEGVHQIPGTKIFLTLSPEIKEQLEHGNLKRYKSKVEKQLSDPKFIAATSLRMSGVKEYGDNFSKIKIASTDRNLISFTRYKDASGNLIIIFDQILSHKEINRLQKAGTCIEYEDVTHMIYSYSDDANVSVSSSNDCDITPPPSEDAVSIMGDAGHSDTE